MRSEENKENEEEGEEKLGGVLSTFQCSPLPKREEERKDEEY